MEKEIPAAGISKISELSDATGFRTNCLCTSDSHLVDTWIEVDKLFSDQEEIVVSFYVNTYSSPLADGIWKRIKNAVKVLFGKDEQQQEILLTKQQALNWISAVESCINDLSVRTSK